MKVGRMAGPMGLLLLVAVFFFFLFFITLKPRVE